MECVGVFLILVIAMVVVLTSVADRIGKRRVRKRLFVQLARNFGGTFDSGGFFAMPSVRIRYGDTWSIIEECRSAGPFPGQSLQIRIAWPHAGTRCEIVANYGQPPTHNPLAWPRYSVAGQDFFDRYIVSASDLGAAQQLMTSGVQLQVERLRKSSQDERLYIVIYDNQIIVRKRWFSKTRIEAATAFVRAALELYDQCMLAKAAGIEFLNSHEAHTLDDVTCKVCGEKIEEDLIYCSRCKTPHHRDCWEYTGACSIYGCRETIYLLPQPSRRLSDTETESHRMKKPR